MNDPVVADLFVEDRAHEAFVGPLMRRIAGEEQVGLTVRVRSARGGVTRVFHEFRTYQAVVEKGAFADRTPDLLVVAIDGNCATFSKRRAEIEKATRPGLLDRLIAACPDPHIERWFLADPDSFYTVVGQRPAVGREKCERTHYKRLLAEAIRRGGQPATLSGIEFAAELVSAMDLYRSGKNDSSFKVFVDDLRTRFRSLMHGTRRHFDDGA